MSNEIFTVTDIGQKFVNTAVSVTSVLGRFPEC